MSLSSVPVELHDIAELQAYLRSADGEERPKPAGYDTVADIIETMSQLRIEAEMAYRNQPWVARDNRRELPLDWKSAYSLIFAAEAGPPQTVITMIAEQFLPELTLLLGGLRRVLRRERQMVPLSQARQLDVQCMRWMTRQPGLTVADKAGARQRVMAVVRNETVDTPENRVVKAFLQLCQRVAREYLEKYGEIFKGHERIKQMRRLQALVSGALLLPDIIAVSPLSNLPAPNYVLRYDPLYSSVWRWYIRLLRQQELIVAVWPYRANLLDEFMRLCLEVQLQHTASSSYFCNELWVAFMPEEGRFLRHCAWDNCFRITHSDGKTRGLIVYSGDEALPLMHWRWYSSVKNQPVRHLRFSYGGAGRDNTQTDCVCYLPATQAIGASANGLPLWCEGDDLRDYMQRLFCALNWGRNA